MQIKGVMSKILSFIALPLSILIALKYFKIYDINSIIPYNVTLLGAIYLVLMQIISYIMVHSSNQGTTFMGKLIKTVLGIPGIIYIVDYFFPLGLNINLEIIIALFLFTEGIYGMH